RTGGGTARQPVGPPARRRHWWITGAAVLILLGTGAAWWATQPRLTFANQLADTVAVQVGGENRTLPPGRSFSQTLSRGRASTLSWRLVRRRTSAGAVGVTFGDTITIVDRGRVRLAATARPTRGAYFAPLITNETGRPLTITVNAGLGAALPCDCTVPPGAMRMGIGYYPLFENSTVRAEDRASGRSATFRDLGRQVEVSRGTVGLLFRAGDLK
ncbi:MAG TPA: hypothetical protein VGQ18_12890, partial [Gemmatimonadales bacterium]|nr:hypothetical protein [Gemmatimonadales bacterium]